MKRNILIGMFAVCLMASPVWGAVDTGNGQVQQGEEVQQEENLLAEIPADKEVSHRADGYHPIDFRVPLVDTDTEEGRAFMTEIPAYYDQREKLPSVRNQGNYGSCWAFAAMAAAEGGLIFQEKQVDGKNVDSSIDLSEYQLARFMYFNVDDPLQNTTGDQSIAVDGFRDISGPDSLGSWDDYLNAGGNNSYATWNMAGWKAGADEATAPYDSIAATWGELDDSVAFQDKVHMQNAYWLSIEQPEMIKQMIMEYGAAASSYMDGDEAFNPDSNAYYSGLTVEEAMWQGYGGHAIALVGWDDNYSRDNFQEDCQPNSDGAWLVRNSWGDWGEQGYFWMSYEERTMEDTVIIYDFEDAENYDYNYQYDGSCGLDYLNIRKNWGVANVFQVKGDEPQMLEAVSIGLKSTNTAFSIQIYKDSPQGQPAGGTPMLPVPQQVTELYAGYHTVELNQPVLLEEGHTFAVVFTFADGAEVFVDSTYKADWIRFVSETAANQSFLIRENGQNTDLHTARYGYGGSGSCSARIKAFTKSVTRKVEQKASPGQDGSYACYYRDGRPAASGVISAPSEIRLSADVINVLEAVSHPFVAGVYDQDGCGIDPSNYTVSYSDADSWEPGVYSVTVVFKGDLYEGSLEQEYTLDVNLSPVENIVITSTIRSIRLSWTEDFRADGYYVYASAPKSGWLNQVADLSGSASTIYTYGNLSSGTDYYFRVESYKEIGGKIYTSNAWNVLDGATSPSKAVTLRASRQSARAINLSWAKVSGANGYQVYRYDSGWKLAANVSGSRTQYTDRNRKPGTTQKYKVRAYRKNGSYIAYGSFSNALTTSTLPAKVKSLQVLAQGKSYVRLKWKKAAGASGYQIFVYNKSRGKYVKAATIAKGSTVSKKMGSLKRGTTYRYKVRAYRKVGGTTIYGQFSSVKKARTLK